MFFLIKHFFPLQTNIIYNLELNKYKPVITFVVFKELWNKEKYKYYFNIGFKYRFFFSCVIYLEATNSLVYSRSFLYTFGSFHGLQFVICHVNALLEFPDLVWSF